MKKIIIVTILAVGIAVYFIMSNNNSQNKTGNGVSQSGEGTLIINTNKPSYSKQESVYVQITSLDKDGKSVCDSNLKLELKKPDGNIQKFETNDATIARSNTCGVEQNTIKSPDYYVKFEAKVEGTYKLTLTNLNNSQNAEKGFIVGDAKQKVSISRWSANQITISGDNRYPMVLTVQANQDFKGVITDSIPEGFSFAWNGSGKIDGNKISWDVESSSGETKELKYEYYPSSGTNIKYFGPVLINKTEKIENSDWKVFVQGE